MYTEYYQDWDQPIELSERQVTKSEAEDSEERLLDYENQLLDTVNWSSINLGNLLIRSAKKFGYYAWDGVDWQQISRDKAKTLV